MEIGADTCVLEVEGRAEHSALPLASVTSREVSRGKKGHTLVGAGAGFVVGAVAGTAWVRSLKEADDPWDASETLVPGGLGLALGALVGSLIKIERWETVPLDQFSVGLVRQRNGRLGLAVSASIRL
jgi:hypothetical protein